MCWIQLALAAVTTGVTAAISARQTQNAANFTQQVNKTQLKADMAIEKVRAQAETNERMREWARLEATNRAAISASGLSVNMSYEQGIEPENDRVARADIAANTFNASQRIARANYEIRVGAMSARSAGDTAWLNAGLKVIGSVGSTAVTSGRTGGGETDPWKGMRQVT